MTHHSIIKDIQVGKYSPLYFLHGDEPYYIDLIADFIENNILNEAEKAFNQIVLYGKDIDYKQVVDEARQFPMMSNLRVIIVKEAQDLKSINDLATYFEKPARSAVLVFCYKYKKLDKRTKISKLLEENGVVFESKKLYDNQVVPWIKEYLSAKGLKPAAGAAELLGEYIGADLQKLSNEIDKLGLNFKQGDTIKQEDVKELIGVSKEFDVFEFQKSLGEKNYAKALLIANYFGKNQNAHPIVMLLSSIYGYFNKIMIAKYHGNKSDQELSKLLGVNPFFLTEYRVASKNYSFVQLTHIFESLKNCDKASKGVGSRRSDQTALLKDFLISCMAT